MRLSELTDSELLAATYGKTDEDLIAEGYILDLDDDPADTPPRDRIKPPPKVPQPIARQATHYVRQRQIDLIAKTHIQRVSPRRLQPFWPPTYPNPPRSCRVCVEDVRNPNIYLYLYRRANQWQWYVSQLDRDTLPSTYGPVYFTEFAAIEAIIRTGTWEDASW